MNVQSEFHGKTVFVTGAANGIGRATALAFAKAGASVALADIDAAGSEVTAGLIRESGGKALLVNCDVTVEADVEAALDETVRTFGGLDVAFNNAGVFPLLAPAAEISEQEWRRMLDVNVLGIHLCMRHEIPIMLACAGGIIVNTASCGHRGPQGRGRLLRRKTCGRRPDSFRGARLCGTRNSN